VPSAAVTADLLAPHVDFFSIGTNDLTQYTLAADRTNPAVAAMADALHPAVLRLIGSVIEAAHAHGKWVGLCGELAGDPVAAPVLLGLGLDEWSMNPPAIPLVKERVRALSREDCKAIAQRCLQATSPTAVREILIGL
jgi:phosphoenolpyruvate-protein kinase (PTS system EI component)